MSEFIAAIFRRKPTIRARKEMGPSERAAARTHFRRPPNAPVLSIFWSNDTGERGTLSLKMKAFLTRSLFGRQRWRIWGLGMVHGTARAQEKGREA